MYFDLALKNIQHTRIAHVVFLIVSTLADSVILDFMLMGSDENLRTLINLPLAPAAVFSFFGLLVFILLLIFTLYWNRLLFRQRRTEIGTMTLAGMPEAKIVLTINCEILLNQLLALVVAILLGLLFYKFLVMILFKIAAITMPAVFYFNWLALLIVFLTIPLLQILLLGLNWLQLKHQKLVDLLHSRLQKRPIRWSTWYYLFSAVDILLLVVASQFTASLFVRPRGLLTELFTFNRPILFFIWLLLWPLAIYGLYAFLLPSLLQLLHVFKRRYYQNLRPFTLTEVQGFFAHNAKSLTGITLLMVVAFSLLNMGGLLSRFMYTNIDNMVPYSILTTSQQADQVSRYLSKQGLPHQRYQDFSVKIIPVSYRLPTVVSNKALSNFSPGMLIAQSSYNQFAKLHHYDLVQLKTHQAILIMPTVGILNQMAAKRYQQNLQINQQNFQIKAIRDQFPLSQQFAFQTAVVVNDRQYANLTGLSEKYTAFDVPAQLSKKQLKSLQKLDRDRYYQLTAHQIISMDKKLKKENTFYHQTLLIRQPEEHDVRAYVGLFMFTGIFAALILVVAMGAILMLKRLLVTLDLRGDYHTLLNMGVDKRTIQRSIALSQVGIFGVILVFSIWQAFLNTNVFQIFVNHPNPHLSYVIGAIFLWVYVLLTGLTIFLCTREIE